MNFLWVLIFLTSVLGAKSLSCDAGYYDLNEWCYRIFSPTTFDAALGTCRLEGGDLVSIHSSVENDYIGSLEEDVFIGLFYDDNTGKYEWTDGTPLDFIGYDDNFEGWKDYFGECAKSVKGQWKNAECLSDRLAFVCKKKGFDAPETPKDKCPDPAAIYEDSGELKSPGYPDKYDGSSGLQCQYQLVVKNDHNIAIDFGNAILGANDSILVYEGWLPKTEKLLGRLPDPNDRTLFETYESNLMLVIFQGYGAGKWRAEWFAVADPHISTTKPATAITTAIPPKTTAKPTATTPRLTTTVTFNPKCGTTDSFVIGNQTSSLNVQSPQYPFSYATDLDCFYHLKSLADNLEITFDYLNIGTDDFVELIDDVTGETFASTNDTIVHRAHFTAPHNTAVLFFHSGSDAGLMNSWAARLTYDKYTTTPAPTTTTTLPPTTVTSSASCGAHDHYSIGNGTNNVEITSPLYPLGFEADITCYYHLYSLVDLHITFSELIIGADDSMTVMDEKTGYVIDSTNGTIKEGVTIAAPSSAVLKFYSGSIYSIFDHWKVKLSYTTGTVTTKKPF